MYVMTPIDQQSTALLYGFCARTSGAEGFKVQRGQSQMVQDNQREIYNFLIKNTLNTSGSITKFPEIQILHFYVSHICIFHLASL